MNGANEKAETRGFAVEQESGIPAAVYLERMKRIGAETERIIYLSEFAIGEQTWVLEKCDHGFHFQCIQR